jgi:hypothetical protein
MCRQPAPGFRSARASPCVTITCERATALMEQIVYSTIRHGKKHPLFALRCLAVPARHVCTPACILKRLRVLTHTLTTAPLDRTLRQMLHSRSKVANEPAARSSSVKKPNSAANAEGGGVQFSIQPHLFCLPACLCLLWCLGVCPQGSLCNQFCVHEWMHAV